MEVIPAIDLKSGRCVRLYQGDYQRETVYSDDPASVALAWQQQGAPRLHLVDLDGAARGNPANLEVLSQIIRSLDIPVQVGGGIRDEETAQTLLAAGADRVVIGTAAVEQPSLVESLCRDHGGNRVVVALDARHGQVAIKGWTQQSPITALELAQRMYRLGAIRLLYTDISRDGTLTEPNFGANAALVRNTGMMVLASGGVTSPEHIRRLHGIGVEGVILGRALYDGVITLPQALAAVGGADAPEAPTGD
jgi:phosphoribosylformimino-5-aminoimidazole carboxamide ribotide isomerase